MSEAAEQAAGVRTQLSAALRQAIRDRDPVAVAAIRSALAAIANAEAVGADHAPAPVTGSPHVAGAGAGLGAGEVPRRILAEAELAEIVRAEIAERKQAATQYARAGHADRATRLRGEASALLAVLESHRLA